MKQPSFPPDLIMVTGGAGFIGSHLCDGLLAQGYRVRVLDDFSTGSPENVPAGCEWIQGSILDESTLDRALHGVSAVSHQAARVTIRGSVNHYYDDARTNLMGTLKLLGACVEKGVSRFIYASSMAVYADTIPGSKIAEDHAILPNSPYGIAKLAAERYVLLLAERWGIDPVVLRYFNTFGPRQAYTPYVGVITIFATQLLQGKGITIFGDGKQTRDFVHVYDIVQANLLALQSMEAVGRVFNIGSGRGTSVNDLATLLKEMLHPDAEIRYEPRRQEEIIHSVADISLAQRILAYTPTTNLRDQIPSVVDFIRSKNSKIT